MRSVYGKYDVVKQVQPMCTVVQLVLQLRAVELETRHLVLLVLRASYPRSETCGSYGSRCDPGHISYRVPGCVGAAGLS